MSLSGDRLARAEERSARARAQATATFRELKSRLAPRRMAQDALSEVRRAGESAAENSADAARRHPLALTSIVAGLVAIALRLLRRKRHRRRHETERDAPRLTSERAQARRARKHR